MPLLADLARAYSLTTTSAMPAGALDRARRRAVLYPSGGMTPN